jgi:Zinc knuckle
VPEYTNSIAFFQQLRQKYVVPFARQLLYTMVASNKRAEVVQALSAARGGVNRVGSVVDYMALKRILMSKAFVQVETLDEAVFKKGVANAAAGTGSVQGVTRSIVMAMKEESASLYNYMTEEFTARARAAPDLNTALYSGNDLKAMANKLILGHHLGATISSQTFETLRRHNLLVCTDAQGDESYVLEVPMQDPDGVLAKLDVPMRKAWLRNFADVQPAKKHDGPSKRKKTTTTTTAETIPTTADANAAAADATAQRIGYQNPDKRQKARPSKDGKQTRFKSSSSPSSETSSSRRAAEQAAIGTAQPPRSRPPTTNRSTPASQGDTTNRQDQSSVQCYSCAEMGHYAQKCTKPRAYCEQCKKKHAAGPCIASRLRHRK